MADKISIESIQHIDKAAREFINHLPTSKIVAFYGQMGAGKTTFIKALCNQMGAKDIATSPSFAIVNEYPLSTGNELIYHFDFYRIKNIMEVYDIGFDDYVASGNYCFIEWPEKIESLLPANALKVTISEQENGVRIIDFIKK